MAWTPWWDVRLEFLSRCEWCGYLESLYKGRFVVHVCSNDLCALGCQRLGLVALHVPGDDADFPAIGLEEDVGHTTALLASASRNSDDFCHGG
jgi:hypothetical protein